MDNDYIYFLIPHPAAHEHLLINLAIAVKLWDSQPNALTSELRFHYLPGQPIKMNYLFSYGSSPNFASTIKRI